MKFRMVPSERAGYGPGLFVVQYHDHDMRAWFDIGDPLPRREAQERLEDRRKAAHAPKDVIEDENA